MKHVDKLAMLAMLVLSSMPHSHAQMKDMDSMHKGMDVHKGMEMKGDKVPAKPGQVHKATGTVTKIDATKGTVTIAHEPVPTMKWPSMTMAFSVQDKGLLDKVGIGKKVDFEFIQEGGKYVLTGVK